PRLSAVTQPSRSGEFVCAVRAKREGRTPSDHFPVTAILRRQYSAALSPVNRELFPLGPHAHLAAVLKLDMNDVGMAADGAVFDVRLTLAGREIDRNDDLFAAGVTNIRGFLLG